MKALLVILLFLASFFVSCGIGDEPNDLIEKDKMVAILMESHILEAKVGRLNLNEYDSASVAFQYLQNRLWEKYDVDSISYNQSYNYYAKYPKVFSQMYEQVEEKLAKMEQESIKNSKEKNNE